MRDRRLVAVLSAIIPEVGGSTTNAPWMAFSGSSLRRDCGSARVKGCPTAEKREEEQVSYIMGQLNDERLRDEWARGTIKRSVLSATPNSMSPLVRVRIGSRRP
jgi:hypothetical protein